MLFLKCSSSLSLPVNVCCLERRILSSPEFSIVRIMCQRDVKIFLILFSLSTPCHIDEAFVYSCRWNRAGQRKNIYTFNTFIYGFVNGVYYSVLFSSGSHRSGFQLRFVRSIISSSRAIARAREKFRIIPTFHLSESGKRSKSYRCRDY